MATYISLDMDFTALCSLVLNEYKEPVTGSSAVSLDTVKDAINSVYMDVFNEPEDDAYLREGNYEFPIFPDGVLATALSIGDTSIVLESAVNFANSARGLLIEDTDIAAYTGSDLTTTLTGVTGVQAAHDAGVSVRQGYPLSVITDLDEQEINVVKVDGITYGFVQPSLWFNSYGSQYNTYTIYNGNLYFPKTTALQSGSMIYNKELTLMTNTTDKPALIPGKFREALLVSGAVMRIGVRDDMRTGYEWHEGRYRRELKKFYAFANNRIKTKGPIIRPSVYD